MFIEIKEVYSNNIVYLNTDSIQAFYITTKVNWLEKETKQAKTTCVEIIVNGTCIDVAAESFDIIANAIYKDTYKYKNLSIWQKLRISFVVWLKGLKLMKSSPEQ